MANPNAGTAFARPDLEAAFSEFSLQANMAELVATRALPVFNAARQSGEFAQIPIEQLAKIHDVERAPGGGYKRSEYDTIPANFTCKERGAEEPIDDRSARIFSNYFDSEQVARNRAMNILLVSLEKRVQVILNNTSTFTGALTNSVSTEWDTLATATPIADILAAREAVRGRIGLPANVALMSSKVFNNLRQADEVKELLKFTGEQGSAAGGRITAQMIAPMVDLDEILVAGGVEDTAAGNKDNSMADVWNDEFCLVFRRQDGQDLQQPGLGRIFHWSGDGSNVFGTVESYREEAIRSSIIRVRHDVDEKLLYAEAGQLLDNITT